MTGGLAATRGGGRLGRCSAHRQRRSADNEAASGVRAPAAHAGAPIAWVPVSFNRASLAPPHPPLCSLVEQQPRFLDVEHVREVLGEMGRLMPAAGVAAMLADDPGWLTRVGRGQNESAGAASRLINPL